VVGNTQRFQVCLNVRNHTCLSLCVTEVITVLFVKDVLSMYDRRKQHGLSYGLKCLQISFFFYIELQMKKVVILIIIIQIIQDFVFPLMFL
jgi:hypothetical protein